MEDYQPILGIDLGTTYSCVSIFQNGKSIIIPNELGERITPSFVSFFDNDERIVGSLAKERILAKQKIIYNSKRIIGRKFEDKEIQNDLKYLPFKLIEEKDKDRIKIKIEDLDNLIRDEYYPEEISAMILQKLKKDSEFYLNQNKLKEVVITTPAYFNQKQRISTKQAAEIAGLKVRKIINEPTAAAIAYSFLEKEKLGNKNLILDFGGGTLDLTLLSFSKTEKIYCKILCSSGDTHLGGQDIDNIIYKKILDKYKNKIDEYLNNNKIDSNPGKLRLLKACEKGKITLSSEKEALILVDSFLPTVNIEYTLKREDFENIIKQFFEERIKPCIKFFLKKCKLEESQIENIIFVGGSTKIPILKDLIEKVFKNSKILCSINPDEVVAIGAGILAGQLNGDKNLKDLTLFDVTSLSLGTNIKGNLMDIIIPKSTPFPIKQKKTYFTIRDDQDIISNKVYEGESENLSENYLLGDFNIKGLTKRKAGETQIELEFELTSNLILKVKAKELNRNDDKINEKKNKVILEEPKGFFKIDEINDLKNSLKIVKKSDFQEIYNSIYQKEIIELKENLFNSKDKFNEQMKIVKHLNKFLSNFDQTKFDKHSLYSKEYTLHVIVLFIEINKLINFKKDINFKEMSKIVLDFHLEQKIETIKFNINDIIWELLDLCNSNKMLYNYLKLKVFKILLESINYEYLSINFDIDFRNKLILYKKIIENLKETIIKYKNLIEEISGNEDIINEKKINLSHLQKVESGLEIKEFIVSFYLKEYPLESINEYSQKCENFQLYYCNYDLDLHSPEYLQLQKIYKELQLYVNGPAPISTVKDEVYKYVDMVKKCINGTYHGKQDYIDELDREDEEDNDEEEKVFKNLCSEEQKILEIIYHTKGEIEKKLDSLLSPQKKETLFKIIKEISRKNADIHKVWEYYEKDDIEQLTNYVKSVYTNNKIIRTIKDFERKIIDDAVLSWINSIFPLS